ncbi:secreted frizzled-related protein 1-like [Myxocyprinus asiaticus]|uniref:secreted frizzled-related protein 1-like n=1 Tax=Myxocyprinus asiaticus TaxID=70543 RepID=UPI0022232925|nr:secreted frizzled-related protein 1-like [Myxocyprinus asiaticus]
MMKKTMSKHIGQSFLSMLCQTALAVALLLAVSPFKCVHYSRAAPPNNSARSSHSRTAQQRDQVSAALTQRHPWRFSESIFLKVSTGGYNCYRYMIISPRAMKNLLPILWIFIWLFFFPSLRASEDEYIWKSDTEVHSYGKGPQCMDIPEDLRLCFNVGYHQMLLPNLLEHETIAEVKQQAGSWVPLVHKACHPGTQVFLCSLFAPVCLETLIYPCRRLCEAVRDSCTPIMEAFGFPWPEMLTCDKFPQDDVCISMNNTNSNDTANSAGPSPVCPPCDNEMDTDVILEHMCASEFAIKTKIKEVKKENLDRKIILQDRRKPVKLGTLKRQDLKKLVLYLKNGADCPCQQLENTGSNYLIMGRWVGKQYILTGIHKWEKSSKEFRKTLKKIKSHKCLAFESVL